MKRRNLECLAMTKDGRCFCRVLIVPHPHPLNRHLPNPHSDGVILFAVERSNLILQYGTGVGSERQMRHFLSQIGNMSDCCDPVVASHGQNIFPATDFGDSAF